MDISGGLEGRPRRPSGSLRVERTLLSNPAPDGPGFVGTSLLEVACEEEDAAKTATWQSGSCSQTSCVGIDVVNEPQYLWIAEEANRLQSELKFFDLFILFPRSSKNENVER